MHCTLISGSQHSAEESDRTLVAPTPAAAEFTVTGTESATVSYYSTTDGFRGVCNQPQQLRSTDGDHRWQ